jgi:hypothetical protein
MSHFPDRPDIFLFGILKVYALLERAHHGYIDVLVDRGRYQKTFVSAIVGRKVGASTSERDSQRRAGYQHLRRVLRHVSGIPGGFHENHILTSKL